MAEINLVHWHQLPFFVSRWFCPVKERWFHFTVMWVTVWQWHGISNWKGMFLQTTRDSVKVKQNDGLPRLGICVCVWRIYSMLLVISLRHLRNQLQGQVAKKHPKKLMAKRQRDIRKTVDYQQIWWQLCRFSWPPNAWNNSGQICFYELSECITQIHTLNLLAFSNSQPLIASDIYELLQICTHPPTTFTE